MPATEGLLNVPHFQILVKTIIIYILFLLPLRAGAENVAIFDMRKSLPMENDEVATREFYINAGVEAGLRAGMYVQVTRGIPVHDPVGNKAQATMNIPVGSLKIIHSERGISVGRPFVELSDEDRPVVELEGILIGDRIDVASATTDEPKAPKHSKKKANRWAANPDGESESLASTAPSPVAAPAASSATNSAPVPSAPAATAAPPASGPAPASINPQASPSTAPTLPPTAVQSTPSSPLGATSQPTSAAVPQAIKPSAPIAPAAEPPVASN